MAESSIQGALGHARRPVRTLRAIVLSCPGRGRDLRVKSIRTPGSTSGRPRFSVGTGVEPVNVLVADSSVLMNLERGGLLEKCFSLPYQFAVPDLLYRNELAGPVDGLGLGESLLALGLRVEEIDGDEVSIAIQYTRKRPSLSLSQAFALVLSASRSWTLLSGDSALRAFATKLSLPCHSVLWILDQVVHAGVSSPEDVMGGLESIRDHSRCRLLQKEIADRIAFYSSTAN